MHNKVKNDYVAAMSHLRRIFKSRQKNKEGKTAFQSELEKTMKHPEGAEGNASKKRVASIPPDNSIGRTRKLSVGENRRVIIQKEWLNSAPTSSSQRDRISSPEKTGNIPQDQAETDWEVEGRSSLGPDICISGSHKKHLIMGGVRRRVAKHLPIYIDETPREVEPTEKVQNERRMIPPKDEPQRIPTAN